MMYNRRCAIQIYSLDNIVDAVHSDLFHRVFSHDINTVNNALYNQIFVTLRVQVGRGVRGELIKTYG